MGFVVSFWLSRQNPGLFAEFSILLILSVIFAAIATLGFDALLIRELSGSARFSDVPRRDLVGFCVVVSVIVGGIASVLMYACIEQFYGSIAGVGFWRVLTAILLQCCCRIMVPILRVSERFVAAQLVESVLQQAVLVVAVVIFVRYNSSLSLVFDCFILATGITVLYGVWNCRSHLGRSISIRAIRPARVRYFAIEGVMFLGSALLLMLNSRVDILYISTLFDPTRFGAYRVAAQVFELSGIVSSTFLATYGPRIVRLLREHDYESIQRILQPATRLNCLLMVAATILAALIGQPIVTLLFPAFPDLYGFVLIFMIFRSISLFFPSGSTLLDLADRQRLSLVSVAISLAATCILLPVASRLSGAYGVAILVGIVLVTRSYAMNRMAIRYVGIGTTVFG
jgi:O-antigen/teichoic acid export membrane protein